MFQWTNWESANFDKYFKEIKDGYDKIDSHESYVEKNNNFMKDILNELVIIIMIFIYFDKIYMYNKYNIHNIIYKMIINNIYNTFDFEKYENLQQMQDTLFDQINIIILDKNNEEYENFTKDIQKKIKIELCYEKEIKKLYDSYARSIINEKRIVSIINTLYEHY